MKLLLILFFVALYQVSFAGSADAVISGMTSSSRTKVKLLVQDVTGGVNELTLTVDGKSYTFKPKHSTVIEDTENGIYVIVAGDEKYEFKMWMVPGSEKIIPKTDGSLHTTFAAVIEASDPRQKEGWKLTPRITIGCELKYSI